MKRLEIGQEATRHIEINRDWRLTTYRFYDFESFFRCEEGVAEKSRERKEIDALVVQARPELLSKLVDILRSRFLFPAEIFVYDCGSSDSSEFDAFCSAAFSAGFSRESGIGVSPTRSLFSFPSVSIYAEGKWSTGSIVKDLQVVSSKRKVRLADWDEFKGDDGKRECSSADAIVGMTLLAAARLPWVAASACVCNGPVELEHAEVLSMISRGVRPSVIGGVSPETCSRLAKAFPSSRIMYVPASVRLGRFPLRGRRADFSIAGFVGLSDYARTPEFGAIKRFAVFSEICRRSGLTPRWTDTNYGYGNMDSFYDEIDLLICSSTSEGGPLGVFEAIAAGVPVISSPVGLVKECPWIWTFSSVDQALALIKLLSDSAARKEYAYRCRSELARSGLTFENALPAWESFFSEAAKASRLRRLGTA